MGYEANLKKLIGKVVATRPARLEAVRRGEHFQRLTLEEIDAGDKPMVVALNKIDKVASDPSTSSGQAQ